MHIAYLKKKPLCQFISVEPKLLIFFCSWVIYTIRLLTVSGSFVPRAFFGDSDVNWLKLVITGYNQLWLVTCTYQYMYFQHLASCKGMRFYPGSARDVLNMTCSYPKTFWIPALLISEVIFCLEEKLTLPVLFCSKIGETGGRYTHV